MRIYRAKDYEEMSRKAANLIAAQVIMKPDCVLGLATGTTPIGTYRQLVEGYEKGDLDFSAVKTVNLDEYKGLSPENNQSYRYFMNENLFRHVNICLENTNVPNGLAEDAEAECARYNQVIRDLGGIDLQLLGLGVNGHIGFNEPDDAFAKETHLVTLTQSTIDANSRLFDRIEDVPHYAFTMGIRSIMQASVVDLPEPAGPVTSTSPLALSPSSSTVSGMPSLSGSGRLKATTRTTAASEPRCRYTLTRKRETPGSEKEKSSSPLSSMRSMLRPLSA